MRDGLNARLTALAAASAASLLIAACATGPSPERQAELRQEGQELASSFCGQCHAVGEMDASPREGAPPLRTVLADADRAALAGELRRGLPVGHTEMPLVVLTADEVSAVMAYLDAINAPAMPE